MMAAELLRYGIQPMVVDVKPGPGRGSKAMLVHARAMELFRQLGLSDPLLAKGPSFYAMQLLGHRGTIGTMDFSQLADTDTVFPFMQQVGQDEVERQLLQRLTERACPVAWETRLGAVKLDDNGATVTLVRGGKHHDWRCGWVVGADGGRSTLRRLLDIRQEGTGREQAFFEAEVEAEQVDSRKIRIVFHENGPLAAIPYRVSNRHRIIGRLPEAYGVGKGSGLAYADVKAEVEAALGVGPGADRFSHIGRFNYQAAVAEQVHRQRCFLIGDAAHGVSPLVSRGMNEGLSDAVNLSWKLAGVVNGRMAPRVLHTYGQERLPAVKKGDGIFGAVEGAPPWPGWLADMRLRRRVGRITTTAGRLRQTFERLSGLDVDYRQSPLSVHHSSGWQVVAGDRLPCLPVFDEKSKTQTDLHRWCEKPGFVLLVLGTVAHHHLNIIGQWIRQKYPREMHLYYLPYSDRNQAVFDAFEVKRSNNKIILIRPDMYIGYINDMLNVSLIDTYKEEILGWDYFGHLPEKR